MLDPGRGRTKTGQLWAYARDDRPWGGIDPPGTFHPRRELALRYANGFAPAPVAHTTQQAT